MTPTTIPEVEQYRDLLDDHDTVVADIIRRGTAPTDRFAQVGEFMRAMGQPVRDALTANLTDLERELRVRLVIEEALEFAEAMGVRVTGIAEQLHERNAHTVAVEVIPGATVDVVEACDALADSLYVVYGSAHTLGAPITAVFDEVHRSNMAKIDPTTGRPNVTPDGKVLKPEGWTPPDIAGVLAGHIGQESAA